MVGAEHSTRRFRAVLYLGQHDHRDGFTLIQPFLEVSDPAVPSTAAAMILKPRMCIPHRYRL